MVRAQMLSELEEIILYKQNADQPDRQQSIRRTWMKRSVDSTFSSVPDPQLSSRLQGCQPDVEVWQRVLQVRSLVLDPDHDSVTWIRFANLCRKSDRMFLAEKALNSLIGERV